MKTIHLIHYSNENYYSFDRIFGWKVSQLRAKFLLQCKLDCLCVDSLKMVFPGSGSKSYCEWLGVFVLYITKVKFVGKWCTKIHHLKVLSLVVGGWKWGGVYHAKRDSCGGPNSAVRHSHQPLCEPIISQSFFQLSHLQNVLSIDSKLEMSHSPYKRNWVLFK